MFRTRVVFPFLLTCILTNSLCAEDTIAVIINKQNTIEKLSVEDVRSIFLGEKKFFANDARIELADQNKDSSIFGTFYKLLASKSTKDITILRAKLVFTGQAQAPLVLNNDEAVKSWVAKTPNGIAYIHTKELDNNVKSILKLGD